MAFHPTSGGTIYSNGITCTSSCNSVTWDGTTSFEIRIKADGYVDYAKCVQGGACTVFGTSATAVSTWPLHFGMSLQSATSSNSPLCYNLQWLSAVDASTW